VSRTVSIEDGGAFSVEPGEIVLDAAARQGIELPHECRAGNCGTCRVKVAEGAVSYASWPSALSEAEAASGFALACQARAESDLVLRYERVAYAGPTRQSALVIDVAPLAADIVQVQLVLPDLERLEYRPGQHVNVFLEDGAHRSFSMASPPQGNAIDLHIRRIAGGRFTEGVLAQLQAGDMLDVEIPIGTFHYHPEDERPILLVATGTGISPIKSIAQALMDDRNCPPVALYWGMRTAEELYLHEQIPAWGEKLFEFAYVPVLSRAGASWSGRRGHVQQAVAEDVADFSEYAIYLCGSPDMIHDAKALFLARGAEPAHVYAEGFSFQRHDTPAAALS
jgi:CDP-4-dehydro-6-deoxyglucose reductase, E3